MSKAISISEVLGELDEKTLPDGSKKVFSIKFVQKDGEVRYFNRAISSGLNLNLKKHAMRGILPVNKQLKPIDHPYPVKIWSIIEFNNNEVELK